MKKPIHWNIVPNVLKVWNLPQASIKSKGSNTVVRCFAGQEKLTLNQAKRLKKMSLLSSFTADKQNPARIGFICGEI